MSYKSNIGTDLEAKRCNELSLCGQQRPVLYVLLYNDEEAIVTSLSSHSMLVDMTPHYSYLPTSEISPLVRCAIINLQFCYSEVDPLCIKSFDLGMDPKMLIRRNVWPKWFIVKVS